MGGQHHAPAALHTGKTRYPLYSQRGGPQGRYGQVRKISPRNGIRSPGRPPCSESIYRMSYPGRQQPIKVIKTQTKHVAKLITLKYVYGMSYLLLTSDTDTTGDETR